MERVLSHADQHSINVISWTWIDRFDYCPAMSEQWQTLRPVLDHAHAEHYFRHLHGQYRDMLTSLSHISTAVDHLERRGMPYLMTAMDLLIFDPVSPQWHQPHAVAAMQDHLRPKISLFEGSTFLQWARQQGFAVSTTWHPLQDAHTAAACLMLPVISSMVGEINKHSNQGEHHETNRKLQPQ